MRSRVTWDNLALAAPALNRHQKSGYDAARWVPILNRCWFAETIIAVRQKYHLTIDRREVETLDMILWNAALAAESGGRPPPRTTGHPATAASSRSDLQPRPEERPKTRQTEKPDR